MKIMNWQKFNESLDHKYYIPTYEECKEICDKNDNLVFFETHHEIDGFQISIFNYRLAQFSDFENPVKDNPKIKGFELRGLCFVFNKDGSLYKRYLLLDKFFNLDQTPDSMYSVVKDYKIKNIFNKEDGSIASFIRLPNGKVCGKSKTSFQSDQAIQIQKIYDEDINIRNFVNWTLDNNIDAIFEYTSPTNRIVLPYANTSLILLRLRNNLTGKYLDVNDYSDKMEGISVAANETGKTLDDLIEAAKVVEGKEGWVIFFENGHKIKLKTEFYNSRHKIFTQELNHENTLISLIISEQIDDIMPQLDEIKKQEIENIINIINRYIGKTSKSVDNLLLKYHGDIKPFAIENSKNRLFPIAIGVIRGRDKIEGIKDHILHNTKNLMQAKKWLDQITKEL